MRSHRNQQQRQRLAVAPFLVPNIIITSFISDNLLIVAKSSSEVKVVPSSPSSTSSTATTPKESKESKDEKHATRRHKPSSSSSSSSTTTSTKSKKSKDGKEGKDSSIASSSSSNINITSSSSSISNTDSKFVLFGLVFFHTHIHSHLPIFFSVERRTSSTTNEATQRNLSCRRIQTCTK